MYTVRRCRAAREAKLKEGTIKSIQSHYLPNKSKRTLFRILISWPREVFHLPMQWYEILRMIYAEFSLEKTRLVALYAPIRIRSNPDIYKAQI